LRGVGATLSGHGPGDEAFDALLYCTERWDGSGYPEGLSGEEIPLTARVFAVCHRYIRAHDDEPQTAAAQLWRAAGSELDPRLVQRFLLLLREQEAGQRAKALGA
jgi:HD-GYP domain-containing protein (c-di-GMP phosphodiesterase class II)